MQKLTLNTLRRLSVLSVLRGHKITDITSFNRASKIEERVELTEEEKEQIHFNITEDGSISWGKNEDGTTIPDFKDIVLEIELEDEKAGFLKEIIEQKIKEGVTLSGILDRAAIEVHSQLNDQSRTI